MDSTEEEKALIFVRHIENHLLPRDGKWRIYPPKVICKICNKTIDEIYEEEKQK